MPINIAGGKTYQECKVYEDDKRIIYTDGQSVTVLVDENFYPYYLEQLQAREQIALMPTEEVVKDQKYYEDFIKVTAEEYNKSRNVRTLGLKQVVIPVGINFAITVYKVGVIYIGPGKTEDGINLPSGKLSFVTNATSETHSFVMKGIIARPPLNTIHYYACSTFPKGGIERCTSNFLTYDGSEYNFLNSRIYNVETYTNKNVNFLDRGKSENLFSIGDSSFKYGGIGSFSQLLIYLNDERGGMTQAEMEGELAKDIKLK